MGNQHIRSEINKLVDIEENYKDNIYKHEKMIQGLKDTLRNIDSIKLYGTMDEVINSFREDTNAQEDLVNIINKVYISIEESKYSNRNKKVHIEVIEYGTK